MKSSRELALVLIAHLVEKKDFDAIRLLGEFCQQLAKETIQGHAKLQARRERLARIASMN